MNLAKSVSNAKSNDNSFGKALRVARNCRGLSQEDFGLVSSRTYLSTLERGMKSPTLGKVEDLARAMSIHPLTLLTLSYLDDPVTELPTELLAKVCGELAALRDK